MTKVHVEFVDPVSKYSQFLFRPAVAMFCKDAKNEQVSILTPRSYFSKEDDKSFVRNHKYGLAIYHEK